VPVFKTGDLVWVRQREKPTGDKLEPKWRGPYIVQENVHDRNTTYRLKRMGRTMKFTTVHASFLKPFKQGEIQQVLSAEAEPYEMRVSSGLVDGDKSLVSLCDRKRHNEVWQYKIKYENGELSNWLAEKTVLRWVSPLLLDEYHSRYDLREEIQQPVHARRTPGQAAAAGAVQGRAPSAVCPAAPAWI
jgi:hypothetical protein